MPSIDKAKTRLTEFPNKFISPFADEFLVPVYSSIPFEKKQNECLPCALCGTYNERQDALDQIASQFAGFKQGPIADEIFVGITDCWAAWTPDPSTVCLGTTFQQTRQNNCTGQSQNRTSTGTSAPNWSVWTPDTSTVCLGTTFQQTRNDLNGKCGSQTQNATGTSAPNWSAWTPDPSTIPCGQVFQQTRNDLNGKCGSQTQNNTGTNGCQTLKVLFARFE